jgi:hypothetical protein
MEKETILEVIKKLIGPIEPVADSAIDAVRENNLTLFIAVFDEMHTMIDDIAYRYTDSPYASQRRLAAMCNEQLDKMGIKS